MPLLKFQPSYNKKFPTICPVYYILLLVTFRVPETERHWELRSSGLFTQRVGITTFLLYFVDRAVCHRFLLITNSMNFYMYLFINFISIHVSGIKCSSSGDRIVLIHHLVWLVFVSDCFVCLTGIPSSHLHRLIIPDDVLTF